jgi:hypothetical protein
MIYKKLIIAEIILILASVLIFRGLWGLLDSIYFMNSEFALIFSFVVGIILSVPVMDYVIRHYKKKNDFKDS